MSRNFFNYLWRILSLGAGKPDVLSKKGFLEDELDYKCKSNKGFWNFIISRKVFKTY